LVCPRTADRRLDSQTKEYPGPLDIFTSWCRDCSEPRSCERGVSQCPGAINENVSRRDSAENMVLNLGPHSLLFAGRPNIFGNLLDQTIL